MKFEKNNQLDAFFDKRNTESDRLKRLYENASFKVSILGGKDGIDIARELGYGLAKNFYSIQTGGYNDGTMKAAMEGADKAIEDYKLENPEEAAKTLSEVHPEVKGIVAGRFRPDWTPLGKNIKTEIMEGDYDLYLRLGKLIEDAKACVILPGDSGTDVEAMAAMHFDKKSKNKFNIPNSPLIFVGDHYFNLLETKFKEVVNAADNIYKVNDVQGALDLIDSLKEINMAANEDEYRQAKDKIKNNLIRFSENKINNN